MIRLRSELLFCYDVTDANPNGDPLDENKPRIDEETNINFVTDVRLKRTIRDYFFEYKGFNGQNDKDIFVREKEMDKGGIQDGKTRAKDFEENQETILQKCIDIRLFGGVLPLSGDSITFTGPVQFKIGRSLHKVELKHIQGTGAFASTAGAKQKTFREEYILPYSFIAFHGIINQNAARHTKMTEEDRELLLEAIWMGTKNLISRSKFGQQPRLLIMVTYKETNFFIGDLDKKISINCENEMRIRSVSDFELQVEKLLKALEQHHEKVDSVLYKIDPDLHTIPQLPPTWQEITAF
ncbi:MAG TPA: type I-B CRISPR-associated protein Cas7/Csh2 [Calditrichaeota bacterium]|nr:type I-B CRISPR-associated protein Cas7/Csh2 [Calditrichota bacterium]